MKETSTAHPEKPSSFYDRCKTMVHAEINRLLTEDRSPISLMRMLGENTQQVQAEIASLQTTTGRGREDDLFTAALYAADVGDVENAKKGIDLYEDEVDHDLEGYVALIAVQIGDDRAPDLYEQGLADFTECGDFHRAGLLAFLNGRNDDLQKLIASLKDQGKIADAGFLAALVDDEKTAREGITFLQGRGSFYGVGRVAARLGDVAQTEAIIKHFQDNGKPDDAIDLAAFFVQQQDLKEKMKQQ